MGNHHFYDTPGRASFLTKLFRERPNPLYHRSGGGRKKTSDFITLNPDMSGEMESLQAFCQLPRPCRAWAGVAGERLEKGEVTDLESGSRQAGSAEGNTSGRRETNTKPTNKRHTWHEPDQNGPSTKSVKSRNSGSEQMT